VGRGVRPAARHPGRRTPQDRRRAAAHALRPAAPRPAPTPRPAATERRASRIERAGGH
jgi:hypothetical protein